LKYFIPNIKWIHKIYKQQIHLMLKRGMIVAIYFDEECTSSKVSFCCQLWGSNKRTQVQGINLNPLLSPPSELEMHSAIHKAKRNQLETSAWLEMALVGFPR
jgi:hypothetical protein